MYMSVIKVEPLENYILHLTFENGEKRQFDMKPYLNVGVFKELKEIRVFNSVKTSFDTIEWENSADFDPEVLYQQSTKIL
jgi:hypothetical protein